MSGFDDLFGGKFTKEDHSFDKEAWAAKKQEERQSIYQSFILVSISFAKFSGKMNQ